MVVDGTCVKVLAWYDNEIGYVHRMIELAQKVGALCERCRAAQRRGLGEPTISIRNYVTVTAAYWAFTLTDGALRMLVLLHFNQLGYTPVQLAFLFLLYEFFGIVTNLVGGWIASRTGRALHAGARAWCCRWSRSALLALLESGLERGGVGRLRDGAARRCRASRRTSPR